MLTRNGRSALCRSHPHRSRLSETDQASLQTFVHRGRANARTLTRARILLKLTEGWTEADLWAAFDVCRNTVISCLRLCNQLDLDVSEVALRKLEMIAVSYPHFPHVYLLKAEFFWREAQAPPR
jgi:hypothetical protein